MSQVVFQNKGLISLDLLQTFGASVKASDNPIGYFGTGLKYAIAILLRNGCRVTLLRGAKTYKFTLKSKTIRGKKLQFIMMNKKQLGFTSDLGKNWKPWMAFRELYSNCMDEEESLILQDTIQDHKVGYTTIIVESPKDCKAIYDPEEFLIGSTPLYASSSCEVHPRNKGYIYYKGIRVGEQVAKYGYNILRSIDLTEDRTISNIYAVTACITLCWQTCTDKALVSKIITRASSPVKMFEDLLNYSTYLKPSNAFIEATLDGVRHAKALTNFSAIQICKAHTTELQPTPLELNKVQLKQFERAVDVLDQIKIPVKEYPIHFVEDLGRGVYGLAENKEIYITTGCFDMGTKFLTATLYEEFLHLRNELADESRELQNFLFDRLFSYVELYVLEEPI